MKFSLSTVKDINEYVFTHKYKLNGKIGQQTRSKSMGECPDLDLNKRKPKHSCAQNGILWVLIFIY